MISNKKQIMALVSNMKKYPAIAQGSCKSDMVKYTWQIITNELNSLGPPIKTWDKWVKVWIDLKAKTKKKLIKYRANSLSNKRNPKKLHVLTVTEDAINHILSLKCEINTPSGEHNPPSMKLAHLKKNEPKCVSSSNKIDHQAIVQPLDCVTKLTSKKEKISNCSKINRVEKQSLELEQDNYYNKIYRSVQNIESILISTFKNEEQYRKEKLALKREKLRVYEENAKKKHKYRMLKLKLKAKKQKMDSFHVDNEI
ncbi:uncharacterized protein LOC119679066 [Teleopsis dalmanni]|uniref:uncharacterized protein LOC119679066 n=1 Tax=Teleopsis dalmanni TaxID=139649 RepID=UPI0018CD8E97|nr:uncharacterized protein LOC119679066 [Teleopsis dalmanni]